MAAFAPSAADLDEAHAIVALFDHPENQGKGAVRFRGQMVERLHLADAHRLLADAGTMTA